ncbi:MAG TPA: hypothetical protein VLM37_10045 [Fibrobacteraceae bacterium]|nr:hypothetical protein [Fibrobacteraceae bacterium]
MSTAVYHPWLFDDGEAWKKTLSDARWSYDLPMSHFMAIYAEYRTPHSGSSSNSASFALVSTPIPVATAQTPEAPPMTPEPSESKAGQILSQNEIDSLLSSLK